LDHPDCVHRHRGAGRRRAELVVPSLLLIVAGLLLVYPTPTGDWMDLGCMAIVIASQKLRKTAPAAA
jgi:hypothetical protein